MFTEGTLRDGGVEGWPVDGSLDGTAWNWLRPKGGGGRGGEGGHVGERRGVGEKREAKGAREERKKTKEGGGKEGRR